MIVNVSIAAPSRATTPSSNAVGRRQVPHVMPGFSVRRIAPVIPAMCANTARRSGSTAYDSGSICPGPSSSSSSTTSLPSRQSALLSSGQQCLTRILPAHRNSERTPPQGEPGASSGTRPAIQAASFLARESDARGLCSPSRPYSHWSDCRTRASEPGPPRAPRGLVHGRWRSSFGRSSPVPGQAYPPSTIPRSRSPAQPLPQQPHLHAGWPRFRSAVTPG
jgi:hypothetical protein